MKNLLEIKNEFGVVKDMFERMAKEVIELDKFVKSSSHYLNLMEEKVLKMTTENDDLKATPIERSEY